MLYLRPGSNLPSERLWVVRQLQHDSFRVQSPLTQDDSSTCLCGNTLVFKMCLWSLALVESCFHRQHSIFHLLLCICIPRGWGWGKVQERRKRYFLCEADVLQSQYSMGPANGIVGSGGLLTCWPPRGHTLSLSTQLDFLCILASELRAELKVD